MSARFSKSFTQQEPIPADAIEAAVTVMRTGKLHRYGAGDQSETVALERDYAAYQGAAHCLACASGGQAIQIALRAVGVRPGDPVLANAYTLAPVPGALAAVGAKPILIEIGRDWHVDLDDLEAKAVSSSARFFLLSHMRGHIADMDAIQALCARRGLVLIEDCAHTMGAIANGRRSGDHGAVACFSTQTYKHLNSGEGGLLTTNDPDIAAKAILLSGSYMLYDRHGAAPPAEEIAAIAGDFPNNSARMDELRAAILRPQLRGLDEAVTRWRIRYDLVEEGLRRSPALRVPERKEDRFVGSSLQFHAEGLVPEALPKLAPRCRERGVEIKWFGDDAPKGYTSRFDHWRYLGAAPPLPQTRAALADTFDLRIPLTFELEDCRTVAGVIAQCADELAA